MYAQLGIWSKLLDRVDIHLFSPSFLSIFVNKATIRILKNNTIQLKFFGVQSSVGQEPLHKAQYLPRIDHK